MSDLSFINSKDQKIFAQKWLPHNEIKSCIILLHGYAEYSRRYQKFINKLTGSGHAVFAFDYQGHGRSEGVRGSAGNFDDLVKDANQFLSSVRSEYTEYPWSIMGHDLGGNIAIKLASIYQYAFTGLILTAPAILMHQKIPKVVQDMARNIASLYPGMPVMRLDTHAISRSKEVVNGYNKDPLVYHGCLRAGMAMCLQQSGQEAVKVLDQVTIPVWIGHGSFDSINDPAGSALIMNRIASQDKTLKIFDSLFHEILNEPERDEVMSEISGWIEERHTGLELMEEYDYSKRRTG
ncbi:MAG: lysophospholipase [Balneolales bacterium]